MKKFIFISVSTTSTITTSGRRSLLIHNTDCAVNGRFWPLVSDMTLSGFLLIPYTISAGKRGDDSQAIFTITTNLLKVCKAIVCAYSKLHLAERTFKVILFKETQIL